MHAGCVQVQAFGTDWDVCGGSCFFDFLKEHMFYKAVMSRLEKAAVGFDRRPDKPVRKRQKGAKKRKISLLHGRKRWNRKEGFDGGNDS